MKVIHFIASVDQSAGGTTAYMQLISRELQKEVELTVVTGYSRTPVDLPGVKILFFNCNCISLLFLKNRFRKILEKEKPDLVHINGIWLPQNWLFQKAARQLGIKVVLSPHGMLEQYILNRHPLKKKMAMLLYQDKAIRMANCLHVTAQSELNQIRQLGYQMPAIVIPNGIDLSEVKQKENWSNSVKNILFMSRIHPKKGIEILIEAVSLLSNADFKVTIAGEGASEYVKCLKRMAHDKGVGSIFTFVGGVYGDKKSELLQQTDLFVLPTYSENFGIVVAEALATGIPVITTTGTPWGELIAERCGWWIELSVGNLTKAIAEAISTAPEVLQTMGERGKELIKKKYEITAVANDMLELYKNVLINHESMKTEFL